MAEPVRTPPRLGDGEVAARIARVDELLEKVENAPGPTARAALDAVRALTEVYGEALARVLSHAEHAEHADRALTEQLAADELLGHLLVLHGIHPEPPARRAARAVERLRPVLQERGGDVELVDVDERAARVRLKTPGCGSGCGSASTDVEEAVREAVLAAAPELTAVEPVPEAGAGAFVPIEALTRRPAQRQGVS
ncbi:NifU family protein [Streptomyces sp. NPDC057197]|uniref:NifU family protein n=1 Tax=unclassified Streptomyces TaxID=2593676 RepID=UPI0033BB6765